MLTTKDKYPDKANTKVGGSVFQGTFVDKSDNRYELTGVVQKASYALLTFDSEGVGTLKLIEA